MKCYVITTSNNKYLKCSFEHVGTEGNNIICVLRESALYDCDRFNEYTLNEFLKVYDNKQFEYGYQKFTLSHIEEIKTVKIKNRDLNKETLK